MPRTLQFVTADTGKGAVPILVAMRTPHSFASRLAAAIAASLLLASCGGGGGSPSNSTPTPAPSSHLDPTVYSTGSDASLQAANEIVSVTRHSQVLDGVSIPYTATAGHLTALTLGTGAPKASFFYVAYTMDGAAPATRPVTFFYNGGPGSASVWLHLGSFAPRRLDARAPLHNGPTPFPLVQNAESMLDISDLVFVDAVGSGYSQAIAPNLNRHFWAVRADAEVFRDFVMRYVIVNQRESSPRFLFGESYGTTRAALHARLLEQAGMSLHGVVLQSSVLDYSNNCGVGAAPTIRCTGYVPSYGATAVWFQRSVPNPPPAGLEPFLAEVRQLAQQEYDPAVMRFMSSQVPPDATLLTRLANATGLGGHHWQAQLNLGPSYYRVNFVPGTLLGRYDSRVTQPGGTAQNDPSSSFISASFAQGIASYLTTTLGYTTPSPYVTLGNAIQNWNFSHDGRPVPDVVPDLAAAMTLNPRLQVLVASGMHDLATPFYSTEQDLARLGASNPNIHIRNYIGGHMTYLDDGTRVRQKADLAEFYRRVLP